MSEASQSGECNASNQQSKPQKCFVAHSYQAEWHETIEAVCNELLPEYGLQPWYADCYYDPTTTLRDKIVSMIDNAPYGIYDLSYWRKDDHSPWVMPCNVLIELGIAIALNRPTLLLRHTGNRVAGIALPKSLQGISQIYEFTGGEYSLEKALRDHLSYQANLPTDCDWQHHRCRFGEINCSYLQVYPYTAMITHDKLHCHIADGPDTDQLDFRRTIEAVLGKFNNIWYSYLDKGNVPSGYTFLLCSHCQLVRSTPFAIYRLTPDTSPDAYVAIGISIGLEHRFRYKIPRFIITKDMQYVPSLLQGYEFVLMKNLHTLKKCLPQFVRQVLKKIDEPTYWRPQDLPFETHVPLGSGAEYEDTLEKTEQEHSQGAYLVVQKGFLVGKRFYLWKDHTTIGRSRASDIFLEDVNVHRKQASIIRTAGGGYKLRDDYGIGDCFVNGKPVTQYNLRSGDRLSFGQTEVIFYLFDKETNSRSLSSSGGGETDPVDLSSLGRGETDPVDLSSLHGKKSGINRLFRFQSTTTARLRLNNPQSPIQSIELLSGMTIGRSRECDIFIEDLTVSRHHATIEELASGVYEIVDHKSAVGTFVNGRPVNRHKLQEGDVIQIGNTRFTFDISARGFL